MAKNCETRRFLLWLSLPAAPRPQCPAVPPGRPSALTAHLCARQQKRQRRRPQVRHRPAAAPSAQRSQPAAAPARLPARQSGGSCPRPPAGSDSSASHTGHRTGRAAPGGPSGGPRRRRRQGSHSECRQGSSRGDGQGREHCGQRGPDMPAAPHGRSAEHSRRERPAPPRRAFPPGTPRTAPQRGADPAPAPPAP